MILDSRDRGVRIQFHIPVALHARARRDQLADQHIFLEPDQRVDLSLDGGLGQHLGRLLEGCRGEEGIGR